MSPGDGAPIDDEYRAAIRRLGYRGVPDLVAELYAVGRRGNDLALVAAAGSGKEALYAILAAERCDPESPEVGALVLSPTREEALRAGRALHELGGIAGLTALAWLPRGRAGPGGGAPPPFAQLVAGRPSDLLPEVRAGRLGLGELRLLVVDGVTALEETDEWEALEAFLDTLDPDAQRVAVDARRSDRLEELARRQLTRPRRWPPELLGDEAGAAGEGVAAGPSLHVGSAEDPETRLRLLAEGLRWAAGEEDAERGYVACPDGETAHRVAADLAARGFELAGEAGEAGIVVGWGEDERPPPGIVTALFGLPLGLDELLRWLGEASTRIAVVPERHRTQLLLTARRAGWDAASLPEPLPASGEDRIGRFRERLRRRIRERDEASELLVLEPLLREWGAARVAAALSSWIRALEEGEAGEAGAPPGRAVPGDRRPRRGPGRPSPPGASWTRLWVNAGERDGVGPGDLVGAITGETGVVGGQIGQIEVRDTYSLVDVDPDAAAEIMERMSGARIKGREVVVRPDREA